MRSLVVEDLAALLLSFTFRSPSSSALILLPCSLRRKVVFPGDVRSEEAWNFSSRRQRSIISDGKGQWPRRKVDARPASSMLKKAFQPAPRARAPLFTSLCPSAMTAMTAMTPAMMKMMMTMTTGTPRGELPAP